MICLAAELCIVSSPAALTRTDLNTTLRNRRALAFVQVGNNMGQFIKRSASILASDRFFFPPSLTSILVDGRVVYLSPTTGNWLVVEPKDQPLLDRLVAGEKIGTLAASLGAPDDLARLKRLLAQITARQFALTDRVPVPSRDLSVKGAYFYLTNACNLRCSHCYMYSGKAEARELSANEWIKVLDEFVAAGGTSITFSGGEVLAKRGWLRVLEHAHQAGVSATVLTNGTLWDADLVASAAPFIAEVQVSLDGPTEATNARTRGAGAFQKAIRTAQLFSAAGVRTSIAMTPTPETLDIFEQGFKEFFEEEIAGTGINVRISHKLLPGRTVSAPAGQEKIRYQETAQKLADRIYPSSRIRSFSLEHRPNELHLNCGYGGASISSTGDVYPCNRIGDVRSVGNVRNQDLKGLFPLLAQAEQATNVDEIAPCKWCDLRYICGGGCRIDDYYLQSSGSESVSFRDAAATHGSVRKDICPEEYRQSLLKLMVELTEYQLGLDE